MSYSIAEEKLQWETKINLAVSKGDEDTLFAIANRIAKFDEDWGNEVRKIARQVDRSNWAHDESIGN